MKTGEDFRKAFPEADEGFRGAAINALQSLKDETVRASSAVRYAVLVAVLLLSAATAVAAGVMRRDAADFIAGELASNMNPVAEEVLARNVIDVPIDTPVADMVLHQAVYDGIAVYLLFEAKPVQAGWMLAVNTIFDEQTDQAFTHGSSYPTDVSIREYAAQQGYAGVQLLEIFADETTASVFDSWMNEDGSCSIMVWSFVRPEYRGLDAITLHLNVRDAESRFVTAALAEVRSPVTLNRAGEMQTVSREESFLLPEAGMAVNRFEVIHTPMTAYLILDYVVTDKTLYSNSLFYTGKLRFADEAGMGFIKGTYPLNLVVDRPAQKMGEGPYYITNRQIPAATDAITLMYADEIVHTFRLQ